MDQILLLAFALANAALYCALQPLWEGFDEAWHYGYAQHLGVHGRLPVLGQTRLSQEVWDSLLACPVSHVVAHAWPELQAFDRYFALSPEARLDERRRLEAIPRAEAARDNGRTNYEAQQPPLAYALLAGPNLMLAGASLPTRVQWLRLLGATLAVLITFLAAARLFRALELPPVYQALGLYGIFACQMFWATVAHVGNDALALPLSIWWFAACAGFSQRPDRSGARQLALATALGLLTKAYFLPLLLVAGCLVAYRRARSLPAFAGMVALLAGPWYVRNLVLYHNLSGLLMTSAGNSPSQAVAAWARVDWGQALPYMLRATLWTGNNSFTNFSVFTLNILLALLAVGLAMYAARAARRRPTHAEGAILGALAAYGAAVLYVVGNDVAFLHGASAGAAPWYTLVLLPPTLALALTGLNRTGKWGTLTAAAMVILWTYISATTYLVKLIPLYGGYTKGRGTPPEIAHWYLTGHVQMTQMLSTISLAPPALLYLLTAAVICLGAALAVRLCHLLRSTTAA